MKPVIELPKADVILTSEITEYYIVVTVIDGNPCILTKHHYPLFSNLTFLVVSQGLTIGNNYPPMGVTLKEKVELNGTE